ncbi:MAG: hypothetical protein GY851_15050, partial [bacterium]|nr:hypothetical protein [bacterium]
PFKAPLSAVRLQLEFNSSGAVASHVDDVTLEPCEAPKLSENTWSELVVPREKPLTFSSWQYNSDAAHFGKMGMKYGWHYRHAEQFDQLKATRTVPFWRGEDVYAEYAKRGIEACVYLYYGALDYRKKHYGGEVPEDALQWIDPVWHDGYVATCRTACEQYAETPGIVYFFVADEPYYGYIKSIVPEAQRKSEIWGRLDAQVREQYGGGQYGLPDGPDDANPHRWIAYMSWATDQLVDTFRRLREAIDASGCDAQLLGPDELSCLCAERWCDLAPYVDVFTGQALATRHGGRGYRPGFLTKAIADFTGKPVHSATQIVGYGGSPSPEEVQRQYSQVLQAGGEGQMLIAVEWFDRELNHHQYSAPERWATIKNFLDLMA